MSCPSLPRDLMRAHARPLLVWLRRDLRLHDHAALFHALQEAAQTGARVQVAFVFDRDILAPLPREDRRVAFIHAALLDLDTQLRRLGSALLVRHGSAREVIPQLAHEINAAAVFSNRDYEPTALARDAEVGQRLQASGRRFVDWQDHVIFERDAILTQSQQPYAVFTPYRRAWEARLQPAHWQSFDTTPLMQHLAQTANATAPQVPGLPQLGFADCGLPDLLRPTAAPMLLQDFAQRMPHYAARRDFPALKGTSYLSTHLRFGTVSIRQLLALAQQQIDSQGAQVWRSELIWREFYQMLLWHRPDVVRRCFKPECDAIRWDESPALFEAWAQGRTGYPLVDAAMRQLNQSGYMHNRLRMVTASFLSKDLGLDWRLGEAYFARQLLDFDLAANNGGWQWAASTGCDAQPWFRIFNPVTQSQKFDPDGAFIRRYVPELARLNALQIHAPWRISAAEQTACDVHIGSDYPAPVVDHAEARLRTLARFGVLNGVLKQLPTQPPTATPMT